MQALKEVIKKLTSEKSSISAGKLESPIEERLLNHTAKYIKDGIEITTERHKKASDYL